MQCNCYKQLFTYYMRGHLGCSRDTFPPGNTSVAMTVLPSVASTTEEGFQAEGDDLCAKDAVKFFHDIDDYSFDDSIDYHIGFSIVSIVLTNW